jgi:hypothetical protein
VAQKVEAAPGMTLIRPGGAVSEVAQLPSMQEKAILIMSGIERFAT